MQKEHTREDKLLARLTGVLNANKDKRVIVVGTTCTGKSTMLKSIKGAEDMDTLVFPRLTKEEAADVCRTPWTEEIGSTMIRLTRERVRVEIGKPVFGTVVLDCDLIVYLRINDDLLMERTRLRGKEFGDAKSMQNQIEREIKQSGIDTIELTF